MTSLQSVQSVQSILEGAQAMHLPDVTVLSKEQLQEILLIAADMKQNPQDYSEILKNKTLLMWFEKPSVRTRVSFETGMTQLGGHAIYLDARTTHQGKASLQDEISCISRYADIIMARVFDHETIQQMMQVSKVPVINGLCNLYHPCQALADVLTIQEHIGKDAVVAYIGDGNNVCNSLVSACNLLGIRTQVATPEQAKPQSVPTLWTTDPKEAANGADVIYTDTWVSMGEEKQSEVKIKLLSPYQVNKELLGNKFFMHCLPALRGYEVTEDVADGETSLIYEQAENRLHVQKAILVYLLCK